MSTERREAIIYGGAFNPPTLAHELVAQSCVDYARERQAEFWVLPSGNRIDKSIAVDRETRLAYIGAMVMGLNAVGVKVEVPTLELDRRVPVETFDTVTELAARHPDYDMTWVFGADSTETMGSWKEGQWLLDHLPKLIIERPGSVVNPLARQATLLTVRTPDVSSTEVRQRLAGQESVNDLVPATVAKLLQYS